MENISIEQNPIEKSPQHQQFPQPTTILSNPPSKSNKLIIAIGMVAVTVIFIAIGIYFYLAITQGSRPIPIETTTQTSPKNTPIADNQGYFTKFNEPSGRFSFEYPMKWKLTKNEPLSGYLSEYLLKHPNDFVTVLIGEREHSIASEDIEKNFSEALGETKTLLRTKGGTNFSQSQFQRADKHFFRLDYTPSRLDEINVKEKSIFIYIVKPNTFYSVSMGAYENVIEDLEHLIQTFE